MLLFVIACVVNPALTQEHANGHIKCNIVRITPPYNRGQFEVCLDNGCKEYSNRTEDIMIYSPVSPLGRNTTIKLKVLIGDGVLAKSEECLPPKFCVYAQKFLSRSLLGNAYCWPESAITSAFIILYFGLAAILLVATIICSKIRRKLITARRKTRPTPDTLSELRSIPMHSFNPTPLGTSAMITVCCIMASLQTLSACQHGYMRHTVNLVCTQRDSCGYEYSEEISFNRININFCIQIDHDNRTVGLVKLQHRPMDLTCTKNRVSLQENRYPKYNNLDDAPKWDRSLTESATKSEERSDPGIKRDCNIPTILYLHYRMRRNCVWLFITSTLLLVSQICT
ncbi:hypothetical protein V3C99_005601 [Haemonchus contortus]